MPLFFVYFVYATILRGTGDSTTPFYALIVSAVLAIAITPLFILGWFGLPKLGVVSAGGRRYLSPTPRRSRGCWLIWRGTTIR